MSCRTSVKLNEVTRKDVKYLTKITINDELIKKYLSYFYANNKEEMCEIFEFILETPIEHKLYKILNCDNEIVGWILLDFISNNTAAINYFISKKYRNRGYSKEAIRKIYNKSSNLGIKRLTALIDNFNISSIAVVKSLEWKQDTKIISKTSSVIYNFTLLN